ncbi:unnamed protein product [Toxocara canis]|uniref:Uncharacterized protein n=1 Tax=Toxocara canis TaxID=6265 RepID=A0A183UP19_TOXCA|nr:unnamed protein product [Toxocara canis]
MASFEAPVMENAYVAAATVQQQSTCVCNVRTTALAVADICNARNQHAFYRWNFSLMTQPPATIGLLAAML